MLPSARITQELKEDPTQRLLDVRDRQLREKARLTGALARRKGARWAHQCTLHSLNVCQRPAEFEQCALLEIQIGRGLALKPRRRPPGVLKTRTRRERRTVSGTPATG